MIGHTPELTRIRERVGYNDSSGFMVKCTNCGATSPLYADMEWTQKGGRKCIGARAISDAIAWWNQRVES